MKKLIRKSSIVAVLISLLMVATLTACSSEAAVEETKEPETVIAEETVIVDKVEETVTEEIVQEEVAEETVEETKGEVVAENTEEELAPQSVFEWSASINASEPVLTIWNDISKEGTIIENGQRCIWKDGDLLVVCIQEKETDIKVFTPIKFRSYGSDTEKVIEFEQDFPEDTLYEFAMTIAGVEYQFSVTLVSENATPTVNESSESTDVSGIEWAKALVYEEPKLLAWNDETGTKEVIDNGGQYIMKNGDELGIYYPEEYLVGNISPIEFAGGTIILSQNVSIMKYVLPSESQTIDLEVEVFDSSQELVIFNYVITTP